MTKCKRMLVAILILSMLSSNVAYAAGSDMGVNVAPVETSMEETTEVAETSVNSTSENEIIVAEPTEVSGEETVIATEGVAEENDDEQTTLEASLEEAEGVTENVTESEVSTESVTEENTTDVQTTQEEVTESEIATEELQIGKEVQISTSTSTILGWLEEMVPESYTLYSDGYSAISVLENPDGITDYTLTIQEGGKNNKLEFPQMDVEYSALIHYYRVAKGKANGTTSVVITMTYAGESASVTVPVTITGMPEGYAKIEDPGLYKDCIQWANSNDCLLDESEMNTIGSMKEITIYSYNYPAYLSTTDLSQYISGCEVLTIQGTSSSYLNEPWKFNCDTVKNLPLRELSVNWTDLEDTNPDFGGYANLEKLSLYYVGNLESVTFSKSCENLNSLSIWNAYYLESITASEGVSLPDLEKVEVIHGWELTDISFFEKATNVKKVDLQSCYALSDVSALKKCTKLTGKEAIKLNNTAVSGADVIDLMYLTDMEMYLGGKKAPEVNVSTTNGVWHIASDSDLISVEKNEYTSNFYKYIEAIKPGTAKVKVYAVENPEIYKEFHLYVKEYGGITGQLGEVVSKDLLPEVIHNAIGDGIAVWDKVNKKVVDLKEKEDIVTNVRQYAGAWVYGINETELTGFYNVRYEAPYYYTGITITDDGVHTYIREYDSESTDYASWPTKITQEDTLQTELAGKSIKQIAGGCILTEDGELYCISSVNTLTKIATGVTEVLEYAGNVNGITYLKNKTLYRFMGNLGTAKLRTDITKLVQGTSYVASAKATYQISAYEENGYREVTYPNSLTDLTYVSKPLMQLVYWDSYDGAYHLLADGTLYNESKGILDTEVKSIDALGYIKNVDGEDVRYVFTGEKVSEFEPDGTCASKGLVFDFMLGKNGLYRQSGSFVLSDVAMVVSEGYSARAPHAIRTDGSIWLLPSDGSDDLPKKIYPISTEPETPVVEATGIAFASEEIVLDTKEAMQVSVNCIPEGSVAPKIAYSVDDHRIATVTVGGMLRAVKNGETTLYAQTQSGLKTSCKVKVVLPIEMTGISVSEKDMEFTLKEGDSRKVTVLYTPEDTTEDRTITWTSSDDTKVSVDADGTIHALQGTMGTPVTITGVSAVHENLKVTCKVSVDKILTEEEIVIPQGITVTNNVTKTLSDITLPEGWAFKEPATKLTECGEMNFPAVYTKEYCVPVEREIAVRVNHIAGVNISGNDIFEVNESETYVAELLIEGTGELQDCYNMKWKVKDTSIAAIEGNADAANVTVNGKKKGMTKLMVTLTLKDDKGNVCDTFTAEKELNVKPTGVVETIKIVLGEDALSHGLSIGEDDATIHVPYNQASETDSSVIFEKNYSFTIDADCYMKGNPVEGTSVKWTSSDKKVATVKTTNGVTKVTLKGDGVAVLTATAQDEGKSKAEVLLSVEDYTPRLENNTLTLNKALMDGSLFTLYPAYEREVAEQITVYETVDGVLTESSRFEVTKDANATYGYHLKLKDNVAYTSVANKNYTKLYLRTIVSEEGTYDIPVKIKVVSNLPAVTINQTDKVNLFYTDDVGMYTISAKDAKISHVEYVSNATNATLPQFSGEWNEKEGTLILSQKNVTTDNYKNTVNKGTIRITFEGYRKEAYGDKNGYEQSVKVGKEYTQPQWVLTSSKLTRYAALSAQIVVGVYDKKDKSKTLIELVEEEITLDTAKLKNSYTLESVTDDKLYISVTGNKAVETLPILIQKDNFRAAKKVSVELTLKKENVLPAYSISAKNIKLNKKFAGEENAVLVLKAKTESDQRITGVNVYANAEAYQNEEVAFVYAEETGELTIALQTNATASKYEFQLAPVMSTKEGENIELAKTKLKVTVVDKAPTLTLSAKGTINPIDRENTFVTLTPKIGNLQGGVEEVVISNEYSDLFDAAVENGKIIIRAKEASEETKLIHKNKYKLNLTVITDVGHEFENVAVTVTPKQGALKVKASVNKITCFKPVKGVKYYVPLRFTVTKPEDAQIENISLLNNTEHFVYDASKEVLYLKNADVLAAKNHKLTFEVKAKGSCDNVKPIKVTVTVTLKK